MEATNDYTIEFLPAALNDMTIDIYDDNINSYVLIAQNIFNIYVNVYGADYMLKNMI